MQYRIMLTSYIKNSEWGIILQCISVSEICCIKINGWKLCLLYCNEEGYVMCVGWPLCAWEIGVIWHLNSPDWVWIYDCWVQVYLSINWRSRPVARHSHDILIIIQWKRIVLFLKTLLWPHSSFQQNRIMCLVKKNVHKLILGTNLFILDIGSDF